mgnify:CR=1 FL=1
MPRSSASAATPSRAERSRDDDDEARGPLGPVDRPGLRPAAGRGVGAQQGQHEEDVAHGGKAVEGPGHNDRKRRALEPRPPVRARCASAGTMRMGHDGQVHERERRRFDRHSTAARGDAGVAAGGRRLGPQFLDPAAGRLFPHDLRPALLADLSDRAVRRHGGARDRVAALARQVRPLPPAPSGGSTSNSARSRRRTSGTSCPGRRSSR